MKFFFSLLFFIIGLNTFSQTWSDVGANWKYSYFSGFGYDGYTEINYVGDEIIGGQNAKKLNKSFHGYDQWSLQYVNTTIGDEYTYESNEVVYLWYNNNWDTLYHFNALVGESWRMAKQPLANACDLNSILTVLSTGTKTINSMNLNYLVVEFNYGGSMGSGITDTIVEKIGFINGYMLPYDYCDGALDQNEGGDFRCYSDNSFSTYNPHYSGACDFIVGLEETSINRKISVTPNPVSSVIHINELGLNEQYNYTIQSTSGKQWMSGKLTNDLNVANLPIGFYFLTISDERGVEQLKFVKQ